MTYLTHNAVALALMACAMVARVEPAAAQKRVALVIGNSAYLNSRKLENPRNDASDMAAKLRGAPR